MSPRAAISRRIVIDQEPDILAVPDTAKGCDLSPEVSPGL
jgi:hypothetical protein